MAPTSAIRRLRNWSPTSALTVPSGTDIDPAPSEDTRWNSRDGLKLHSRGAEPIPGAVDVEGRLGRTGAEVLRTDIGLCRRCAVRGEGDRAPGRSAGSGGCHRGPQAHALSICHRLRM